MHCNMVCVGYCLLFVLKHCYHSRYFINKVVCTLEALKDRSNTYVMCQNMPILRIYVWEQASFKGQIKQLLI
jgi:hypothetical protein